jgi:hypothetical protein
MTSVACRKIPQTPRYVQLLFSLLTTAAAESKNQRAAGAGGTNGPATRPYVPVVRFVDSTIGGEDWCLDFVKPRPDCKARLARNNGKNHVVT